MPYRTGGQRTTRNPLREYTAKSKRKRTGNVTKVRYQRPTARNQQRQIMTNARMVSKLYKAAMTKRVFCDWQATGTFVAQPPDPQGFNRDWFCLPLTDFSQWGACLRQDANVTEGSSTYIQRMQLNMRYFLRGASYANFNVFIVTPRKDAANNDVPSRFAAQNFPTPGVEYIEGPDAYNFRLNPAVFKVHYASYKTLTNNSLQLEASAVTVGANPFTSMAKDQANIKCGINVRMPVLGASWTTVPYMQQAYYKRYFMLVCIVSDAPPNLTPLGTAKFTFDQLATTVNDT